MENGFKVKFFKNGHELLVIFSNSKLSLEMFLDTMSNSMSISFIKDNQQINFFDYINIEEELKKKIDSYEKYHLNLMDLINIYKIIVEETISIIIS